MGVDTDQATGQPACSNYLFTASSHASGLLSCMRELRETSTLCDVTLCAAQEEFHAHRVVLAASSPYFNAMFTHHHLESSSARVELNGVDSAALKSLIDFAYSSSLVICEENVQAVLAAANLLQITSVVEACCEFLTAQVDVDNCLGIAAFAEMLSCQQLFQVSWRFALENFNEVRRSEEYLSTPAAVLAELVRSENLRIHSEDEVLEGVMHWYTHDQQTRAKDMPALLRHVKLPLIPWSILADTILPDHTLSANTECQQLLDNARNYQSSPSIAERFLDTPDYSQFVPRQSVGEGVFVYVVGGETTPGRSTVRSVERYNPSKNNWTCLSSMEIARRGVGVTLLNGLLYVVGGSNGIQALKSVECYDPRVSSWVQLSDMTQERSSVAAACISNRLYAIGGYDGITRCLKTVESFDPETNTWATVAPMNVSRSMHDAAVLGKAIYVVGGYDGSADLASCEMFDVELNRWVLIASMHFPRCMAGVGVLGDQLFVVGGCDCSLSLSSVEKYNVEKGEWQEMACMSDPRSGHGVGVVGRKLYALGGYMGSSLGYSSSIECYDLETNNWSAVGSMSAERRRFGCCS